MLIALFMPEVILKNLAAVVTFADYVFLLNTPLKKSLSNQSIDKI